MVCVEVADLFGETTECGLAELMNRASLRDDQGCNYIVVSQVGEQRYPIMVIYFKNGHAVVTYFEDEESGIQLLKGDSSICDDELIQFRSPTGGYDRYTGHSIVRSSTAARFLQAFATGTPWPSEPSWENR
jgi:hypothetical protein